MNVCVCVFILSLCPSPGQDNWNGTQQLGPGKALPPSRGAKTPYREHPYRQYWSRLATPNVSPWLPPVSRGSSCFKQPDKSNCPFCLWFGLFSYTGLNTREQIGNWKSELVFEIWPWTPSPTPTLSHQPTTHPSIQPTKAAFRWVRQKLASVFLFSFI